jgi:hypothetical protein
VNRPEPSGTPSLDRRALTKAEYAERCRREVEACRRAGQSPSLTPAERLGAMQGEINWLVALQMAEEAEIQQRTQHSRRVSPSYLSIGLSCGSRN